MGTLLWFLLVSLTVSEAKKKCIYDKSTCGLPHREYLKRHPDYKFDTFKGDDNDDDPMRRKIMGGVRAEKGELPWSVLIKMNFIARLCGGTLITKRHVISAAHCFWGLTSSLENEDEEGCKAYYQGFFDKACNFTNDIAILELSEDVPDDVNHICLPFLHDKIKELKDPSIQLSASGWGADPGNSFFAGSPFLQNVKLGAAMPEKVCKKLIPKKNSDTFCTYERPDTNVCNGDSGGGIVANVRGRSFLMGIVSYGSDCNDLKSGTGAPSAQVNTNVMHFVSLIKKETRLKDKNRLSI